MLPIRHTLDVMHVERNVSSNVLKHVMGEKDTVAGRRDMEEAGKFQNLWLQRHGDAGDYLMPAAPWVFSPRERTEFINVVSETRVPTGYSAILTKHVGEQKLADLKSHDHRCLLQQIMLVGFSEQPLSWNQDSNYQVKRSIPPHLFEDH